MTVTSPSSADCASTSKGAAERGSASTTVPRNVTSQAKRCVLELHHLIANDRLLGSDFPVLGAGGTMGVSIPGLRGQRLQGTGVGASMRRCAPGTGFARRVHPFAVSPLTRDRWPKPSRIILRYLDQVIAHAPLTPSDAVSGQRCDPRGRASAHDTPPEASARRGRRVGSWRWRCGRRRGSLRVPPLGVTPWAIAQSAILRKS